MNGWEVGRSPAALGPASLEMVHLAGGRQEKEQGVIGHFVGGVIGDVGHPDSSRGRGIDVDDVDAHAAANYQARRPQPVDGGCRKGNVGDDQHLGVSRSGDDFTGFEAVGEDLVVRAGGVERCHGRPEHGLRVGNHHLSVGGRPFVTPHATDNMWARGRERRRAVRHHRGRGPWPLHGVAPGQRAENPRPRHRRRRARPRQDRDRRGAFRARLRRRPQPLLPACNAPADGAPRLGLGVRPRGLSLSSRRFHADQPRGHARRHRPDLRRAAGDKVRLRPDRGRGQVPRLHAGHVPGLAGEGHHLRPPREEGRLRREHAFHARPRRQGPGRGRGTPPRREGDRGAARGRVCGRGGNRPRVHRVRAPDRGRRPVGARHLAHARAAGHGDRAGPRWKEVRAADVDVLVPPGRDARSRSQLPDGQPRQDAACHPRRHGRAAARRRGPISHHGQAMGHLLQAGLQLRRRPGWIHTLEGRAAGPLPPALRRQERPVPQGADRRDRSLHPGQLSGFRRLPGERLRHRRLQPRLQDDRSRRIGRQGAHGRKAGAAGALSVQPLRAGQASPGEPLALSLELTANTIGDIPPGGVDNVARPTIVLPGEGSAGMMDDPAHHLLKEILAGRITRRELIVRAAVLGLSASALGALLAACGTSSGTGTAAPTPKRGGVLRAGLTGGSSSDTLDPHMGLTYLDTARANQIYQPLLQLNANAQTEMVLAEEITPNGSTSEWTIKLRKGITFHDGKPLTADDVIFTFQRILNPKAPLTGATPLGPVDLPNVKKVDSLTVQVPMTSPFGSFIDQLSYWYYLYIVPAGFDASKPNGTGPVKFQSFSAGQQNTFIKNTNYWKSGLPYLDSVTIIDFADSASLQNALVAGQIDAAGALEGAQLKVLSTNSAVKTVAAQTGSITPFTMRVDQAPFNDARVRQAFRFIVNRKQLISAALDGYAFAGADVSSPYDPDFDSSLHREQDIEQAKSLLKAAGQSNLTVDLVTSPAATGMVQMATVFAQQAKQAGVTVNLKSVDPSTFFGPNYLQWTFSQDFYNYSPYLAQVAQSLLPSSPFNETHWSDSNYASLYQQANATLDAGKRKDIEHQMQQIDFKQGGYIIPCFIDSLDAYSSKLTGYTAAKVGQPLSLFDFEHFGFIS